MMNLITLPKSFWGYALETAACIRNMVPTKKVDRTPYEIGHGKAPKLSYLRVWGCKELVKQDTPDKLDSRSIKCIFVGYPKKTIEASGSHELLEMSRIHHLLKILVKHIMRYGYYVDIEEYELGDINEPPNYKAALADPEFNNWLEAMNTKVQSMRDNQVWYLVDLPSNGGTVGYEWLFKKKTDMDGPVKLVLWQMALPKPMDLREAVYILGIKIICDRSKRLIAFSPSACLEEILKNFIMENSKKGYTLMMEKPDYRKSQGVKTPTEAKPEDELKVSCYADASFQTIKDDTKSQMRYVSVLNGGVVVRKSAKQSTTAMSSTEAEYIAAAEASMESVWMRKFIDGLGDVMSSNKRPIEKLCFDYIRIESSCCLDILDYTGLKQSSRYLHRLGVSELYNKVASTIVIILRVNELNGAMFEMISTVTIKSSLFTLVYYGSLEFVLEYGIPTASDEFPLPEDIPTASEERFPLLRDSYDAPQDDAATGSASDGSAKKKGRPVTVTTEYIQKRRNDVKARTTLSLALPDEHQLRFSKYKTAQELWAAILKTFGGNEATRKTKKNQLKQQNRSDLDTISLDDLYNHLKVYEPEVQKKSDSQNITFISSAKKNSVNGKVNTASIPTASTQVSLASANVAAASISLDTACAYIASQSNGSQIMHEDINQIDKDDIEEMDIKWNMALLSMRADRFWKKTGKKISIQGTVVAGFDKSKVECFNCHKMVHFARECRALRSQDRGRRENYRQEEDHALVADEEAPTEFALMAKSSSDNETGLLEFADDTITDYTRPSPSIESNPNDLQNNSSSISEIGESTSSILSKPEIKFVKAADSPTVIKTNKDETVRKPSIKYAEIYRKTSKSSNVDQGKIWAKNNYTHKSRSPRTVFYKSDRSPTRTTRPNMNVAQPKRTSFYKPAHSYVSRPFQRKSAVRTQVRVPRVPTVNKKFPTVNRKFPTSNLKVSTADLGNKGKAGNSQNNIDDKGYWDSGCSRHMTGNISYLSDYKPYDRGYVSFGQGGCKITGKGTIKTVAKASADESELWHRRLGHLNFKTINKLVRHNLVRGLPSRESSIRLLAKLMTDDFFRFTWTFFQKTKDETSGILRNFITEIENLKDLKVKIIRCDNGGEFRNKEMNDFCSRKGIKKEFSNAKTPQRNGVAERRNRTLIEAARTMLADAKLPVTFWAEAVNTACYVQNRVLVNKSQNKTPYELFNGTKDAASQDVKKDVSSLRYIALLNWFHEAHLESSTSNAQDACKVDAPKAVETPIPLLLQQIPGTIDRTLFIRRHRGDFILVQVYVDDIIFGSSNLLLCREFEALMHEKFQISAMGDILKKFGYSDVRSANTPMDQKNPWGKDETGKDVDLHLYRSMIGSLMYLTASRPDIMFVTIVATSTTEAEYVAATSGCGQVLWIQNQLLDYGLAFCDYHNMVAILEKYEHNVEFHQIVDFVEASPIRYALTINPTFYVSHIRQFWSTARIETTDEGTKILATVDGKPKTIFESSIRRNLKLKDEAGISSLPDAELFENLTLMGYNISPNQKFSFQKGEGSRTPTEPHHTPSPEVLQSPQHDLLSSIHPPVTTATIPTVIPTDIPQLRQYTRRARIAQSLALPTVADEPASPLGDDSQGEACLTISGLEAEQDRANIIKTSTLPHDSPPMVTSLAANEGSMQQHLNELTDLCTRLQRQQTEMVSKLTAQDLEIVSLKAIIKMLEDKDGGVAEPSGEDATIKGRSLETGEKAGEEKSTERGSNYTEELANVLTSLDAANILTSGGGAVSVSPAGEIPTVSVHTGSDVVPTASPIFTTTIVATPYLRRKARQLDEAMARDAQRMNEQITRDAEIARIHAEEELQMMINGLDRSNEMIAKHLHEYEQAAVELTIGEKIELINELTKHFKGMSLEEIKEKFVPVWKQIEDFVPMDSKEEGERMKRKGLRLEQESPKKVKISEEVSEEDLKEMLQLVLVEELWVLVKETPNIRQATSDKEKELWVELKRLYEPDVEDQLWTQTQALMHDPVE
uniref:Integrase catalytic domain-containing protein n=1 Tax=Tanacetum cinerariifolium TaxID=118510 RepID=A0A6L2LJ07_TANCI|nr:hypothetical protein [Tanacetum cinerariifolium]